eukprot:14999948-Heterocapsa_arctica.AAC.1
MFLGTTLQHGDGARPGRGPCLEDDSHRLRRGASSRHRASSSSLRRRVASGHAGGPTDAERIRSWTFPAGRGGI